MIFDLFYRIMPQDLMSRPFYINSFLPIYTFASYRMYGYNVALKNYKQLEKSIIQTISNSDRLKLKGLIF